MRKRAAILALLIALASLASSEVALGNLAGGDAALVERDSSGLVGAHVVWSTLALPAPFLSPVEFALDEDPPSGALDLGSSYSPAVVLTVNITARLADSPSGGARTSYLLCCVLRL